MKKRINYKGFLRITILLCILFSFIALFKFNKSEKDKDISAGFISQTLSEVEFNSNDPKSTNGNIGFPETVDEIMERERLTPKPEGIVKKPSYKIPVDRSKLPSDPNAKNESSLLKKFENYRVYLEFERRKLEYAKKVEGVA